MANRRKNKPTEGDCCHHSCLFFKTTSVHEFWSAGRETVKGTPHLFKGWTTGPCTRPLVWKGCADLRRKLEDVQYTADGGPNPTVTCIKLFPLRKGIFVSCKEIEQYLIDGRPWRYEVDILETGKKNLSLTGEDTYILYVYITPQWNAIQKSLLCCALSIRDF